MGALLALGLAARSRSWIVRVLAGGSLVVLLATQYFTFSCMRISPTTATSSRRPSTAVRLTRRQIAG